MEPTPAEESKITPIAELEKQQEEKYKRRSSKEKMVDTIQERIIFLKKQLNEYDQIKRELDSYEAALNALTGVQIPRLESAKPAPSPFEPRPAKDPADLYKNDPPHPMACNGEGIRIGMMLPPQFTAHELAPLLENDKSRAYNFIASWKRNGWIGTVRAGLYFKSETFGT